MVTDHYITRFTRKAILSITCEPCNDARLFDEYGRTGRLTSALTLMATLIAYNPERYAKGSTALTLSRAREIDVATKRLQALTKQFEREVWYRGLQAMTCAESARALSCEIAAPARWGRPAARDRRVQFLSYCLAGRCMMTVKAKYCEVTVITADDEPPGPSLGVRRRAADEGPMGLQSVYGTEAQAVVLLQAAMTAWKAGLLVLRPDRNVSIL